MLISHHMPFGVEKASKKFTEKFRKVTYVYTSTYVKSTERTA